MTFEQIMAVFTGNDGNATKAMYDALTALGPAGEVALNIFRATKTSGAAKRYRGRGFRSAAYDRKQFSIDNLAKVLLEHGTTLDIRWGWGHDEKQPAHKDVLYIDLPDIGQVSFHTGHRGIGPDYPKEWDGQKNVAPSRACRYCVNVFNGGKP